MLGIPVTWGSRRLRLSVPTNYRSSRLNRPIPAALDSRRLRWAMVEVIGKELV